MSAALSRHDADRLTGSADGGDRIGRKAGNPRGHHPGGVRSRGAGGGRRSLARRAAERATGGGV
jgi:hypothetical protein